MITSGPSGAMSSSQVRVGFRQSVLQQRVPAVEVGAGVFPARGLAADRLDDVVGAADGDRADVDDPIRQRDGLHQRMAVGLNETRHDAAVTEVDGPGVGADERGDLGAVTHGDDPAVGHGERLGRGSAFVDGQNGSGI